MLDVSPDGIVAVGFVPALIHADGSTEPLRPGDQRAADVCGYLQRITADRGFTTTLRPAERHGYLLAVAEPGPQPEDAPSQAAAVLA